MGKSKKKRIFYQLFDRAMKKIMKRKIPVGLIILMIFNGVSMLGYLLASTMGLIAEWEITPEQRLYGLLTFVIWGLTIYFILKPSEQRWEIILTILVVILLIPIYNILTGVAKMDSSTLTEILLGLFVIIYIIYEKGYFFKSS